VDREISGQTQGELWKSRTFSLDLSLPEYAAQKLNMLGFTVCFM
jgi:hypothetical protein